MDVDEKVAELVDTWRQLVDGYDRTRREAELWTEALAELEAGYEAAEEQGEPTHPDGLAVVRATVEEKQERFRQLEADLEPSTRRRDPPYKLLDKWDFQGPADPSVADRLRRVFGAARDALLPLIEARYRSRGRPRSAPDAAQKVLAAERLDLALVIAHQLGHAAPKGVDTKPLIIARLGELLDDEQVGLAYKGKLSEIEGHSWNQHGGGKPSVAILLFLAGVSLAPRKILKLL